MSVKREMMQEDLKDGQVLKDNIFLEVIIP